MIIDEKNPVRVFDAFVEQLDLLRFGFNSAVRAYGKAFI
jgi:hypothetical protein